MAAQRQPTKDNFFDDREVENLLLQEVNIPNCDSIPRQLWYIKMVVLHNADRELVTEEFYYIVNSEHVVGSNDLLRDSQVVVQISNSLCLDEVPDNWKYSLRVWPIDRVILNGASLKDHDLRDE